MADSKEDVKTDGEDKVAYWLDEIEKAGTRQKDWETRADKVLSRYRDEKKDASHLFNILWSNTETLKPAVYARTPVPDIRRRFKDKDPVSRQVSEVLERALSATLDLENFDGVMRAVVEDYCLPGRGVARVKYEPTFGMVRPQVPVTPIGQQVDMMGNVSPIFPEGTMLDNPEIGPYMLGEPEKRVIDEKVRPCYWYWKDYRFGHARKWYDRPWEGYRGYFSRKELRDKWPDKADKIALTYTPKEVREKHGNTAPDDLKQAEIWEIWDKTGNEVIFVSPGYKDDVIESFEPELKFGDFYPSPDPVMAVSTNDSLTPIPFYCQYQELAEELDEVSSRIKVLTKELKAGGAYKAAYAEMERIKEAADGEFVPIDGLGDEKISDMVMYWPIEQIANVLLALEQRREQIKQNIYEITGLSDIVRGQGNAQETATAQRIKGQFAELRLSDLQGEIQRFARDMIRKMAEVMAENFEPSTLEKMTGMKVTPEMVDLMRQDRLRSFRIDIETDSTIALDAADEQSNAIEMITAVTGMIKEWAPLVQGGIIPMEAAKEIIMFGVRQFKGVRRIEDALDAIGTVPPKQGPSEAEVKMAMQDKELQADAIQKDKEHMFEAGQNQLDRTLDVTLAGIQARSQQNKQRMQ